jgi:hypothetical protein
MLSAERRLTREELIRESGANAMLLQDAVSASLIVAADHYGEDSLAVLRALVELQRSGIEPRHLRGFRAAAERELGLIESALIPVTRRRDASSSSRWSGRASFVPRCPGCDFSRRTPTAVSVVAARPLPVNTDDTPGR